MSAETVLLVDDDPAVVELVREILETAGFRVATAADGREALAALEGVRPQLVISDIRMPGMDGYRLYTEVRARPEWITLPFIFLSGLGDEADIREGKKLGVDDYLVKPVAEEDLLVAVRSRLQRRAQLEAARERQVDELKRSILTTLTHELRTPLTYLSGYAELLREAGSELKGEEPGRVIDGILQGSDRLRRLVEDLVMLVDLQSGAARQVFERERRVLPDVASLLRAVVSVESPRAAARGVRLVADLAADAPPVLGHPDLLSDAVARLVDNAIKFSKKEGGTVALTARRAPGGLLIELGDEGVGIPAEALGRISEMFLQVGRDRMEQQGCGVGLTIVAGIVAMHGGTLTVTSEVGVGSRFRIQLPAV